MTPGALPDGEPDGEPDAVPLDREPDAVPDGAPRGRVAAEGLLVARTGFLLARREPSALTVAAAGAAVVALLFLGLGLITARTNDRAGERSFSLAVAEDARGGEQLLADLEAGGFFVVSRFADEADAVIDGHAALAVRLPDDTDERLAAGEPVRIEVLLRARHDVSLDAFGLLWDEVSRVRLAQLQQVGGSASTVRVDQVEVSEDEQANQVRLGQALAAMVCFLCVRLVGSTAAVLGRAGDARANEALLLLPLDRRALAGGLAAGTAPLHAVHLLVALTIVLAATLLPLPTLGLSPSTVAAMVPVALVGTLLMGALAAGVGALAGALGVGSEETVSVGDLLALPFVAIAVLLLLAPAASSAPVLASAIPVLGPTLLIRDGVVGAAGLPEVVLAAASTLVVTAGAVRAAGRALGREGKVLRVTI